MACASSKVNIFRLKTSGGIRPPMASGILETKIRLDPSCSICAAILPFRPLMIEDIPITVATPITIPSTVRKDLRLFLCKESRARRRISFISQRHNRIEVRGLRCRINAEEQAHTGRNHEAERHGPPLDGSWQRRQP